MNLMSKRLSDRARVIAYYLPQYYPTPENDEWWGKGFTEWTNVAKARPLYPGHDQPRVPRDLGFYDLRVPETRQAQADLAAANGVEGFCYWHYWFAGRRVLNRPFDEVLKSGKPDFPFCLGWANETWTGAWMGAKDRILIEQTYPGMQDHADHFAFLLKAFRDERYIRVDGKPVFAILFPHKLPESKQVTDFWRQLATKAGLPGLHLVALAERSELPFDARAMGFDAVCSGNQLKIHAYLMFSGYRDEVRRLERQLVDGPISQIRFEVEARELVLRYQLLARKNQLLGRPRYVYQYRDAMRFFLHRHGFGVPTYPTLVPNWDHSPRCGTRSVILHGSTPGLWRQHVREVIESVQDNSSEHRLVFVKSWNEWAEGNYLEPDLRHGDAYLRVLRDEMLRGVPSTAGAASDEAVGHAQQTVTCVG